MDVYRAKVTFFNLSLLLLKIGQDGAANGSHNAELRNSSDVFVCLFCVLSFFSYKFYQRRTP